MFEHEYVCLVVYFSCQCESTRIIRRNVYYSTNKGRLSLSGNFHDAANNYLLFFFSSHFVVL